MFDKIGLAIALSPSAKSLIGQAYKLKSEFSSKIYIIHAGHFNQQDEAKISSLLTEITNTPEDFKIIWKSGNPANSIIQSCKEYELDLLILGALEKEPGLKYFVGSVARKIMRNMPASLLVRKAPVKDVKSYKTIGIQTDLTVESENFIRTAYEFAKAEKAEKIILIRELKVPGLAMTVYDSGSVKEAQETRIKWVAEESVKIELFIKELNLSDIPVDYVCLYGKEGWESNNYLKSINADLYVLSAPERKLEFLDRIFQHSAEYIFEDLPCDLLILKN